MKSMSLSKKWLFGLLITLFILATATLMLLRWQVNHILGGNTQVVDVSQFKAISGPLAITDISVLTGDSRTMRPNQTVLISNNQIDAVGQDISIPDNYHVIDGAGKYLIPGLIDSHVHLKKSKNDLLLYIANGVTHIGEMTGMEEHFGYREQIKKGAIGPSIYIASPKMTSQKGMKPTLRSWFEKRHQNFSNPLAGRQAVRKFKSMGYDAIKMSSDLSEDIYLAINDEAQKLKIPVIGHLPNGLGMKDLYGSGQSQIAHITSITQSETNVFGGFSSKNKDAYLEYIRQNADAIAAKLKQSNIVVASTVWLYESTQKQNIELTDFLKSIELEYQNSGLLEGNKISRGWLPDNRTLNNQDTTDEHSKRESQTYWETYNQAIAIVTQALVRNGVMLVAGTDTNGANGVIAGFSLHDELALLNQIGLSNAQVLQSATWVPAQWMGTQSGKIEVGYRADLVLLDKNPLVSIENTKSIDGVIAKGQYLDRTQLDHILDAVKNANNRSRKINIDEYLND